MDCVFDQAYSVPGADEGKVKLDFSQSIFMMEDVDAASTVVQAPSTSPPARPLHPLTWSLRSCLWTETRRWWGRWGQRAVRLAKA